MKRLLLIGLLLPAVVSAGVMTVPVTRVEPQYRLETTQFQECVTETITPEKNGTGSVTGAIVGGVIGSQIAKGGDRTLGAGVGAIAGAVIGDNVANRPTTQQRCTPRYRTTQVPNGFMVYFKIGDTELKQHMNVDPGLWVTVTITVR